MVEDFPVKLSGSMKAPWMECLINVNDIAKGLKYKKEKNFHTIVMKIIFCARKGDETHILGLHS